MNGNVSKLVKGIIVAILIFLLVTVVLTFVDGSIADLVGFLDLRVLIFEIVPVVLVLLIADLMWDYVTAIKFIFGYKEFTIKELNASRMAISLSIKSIKASAIVGFLINVVGYLMNVDNFISALGPYLSIAILFVIYSVVFNLVQMAIKNRIEKELMYRSNFAKSTNNYNNIEVGDMVGVETQSLGDGEVGSNELFEKLKLTRRENEIFELLVKGKSNRDISEELYIAETTIKKHIQNILKKADCGNRVELIEKFKV